MTKRILHVVSGVGLCASLVFAQPQLTPEQKQQIEAALPRKAPAKPRKARRLLVTNLARNGDRVIRGHPAIPAGNYAIEMMGKRTGAYEVVFSDAISLGRRPRRLRDLEETAFFPARRIGS